MTGFRFFNNVMEYYTPRVVGTTGNYIVSYKYGKRIRAHVCIYCTIIVFGARLPLKNKVLKRRVVVVVIVFIIKCINRFTGIFVLTIYYTLRIRVPIQCNV